MIKKCLECKGKGYKVTSYKMCKACNGTGVKTQVNLKNHFKGVSNKAVKHFQLDEEEEVPCDICNGKGEIEVHEICPKCNGKGEINICRKCGKEIGSGDLCDDCETKTPVYVLHPSCDIDDLEIGSDYRGKITRVENYGVFVSLSKKVFGLLRMRSPHYRVGDELFVHVIEIKRNKGEVNLSKSNIEGKYEIVNLRKNISRVKVADITKKSVGKTVRIAGEIIQIQQTTGPTIFTISDETSTTWAAAFEQAGVRVYPKLKTGDIVEIVGEVSLHNGEIQIESESIEKLEGEEEARIRELIREAIDAKAEPENTDLLIESETLQRLKPKMKEAAKAIRRAVLDGRSILVRHHADADGICAGVAIEKAVVPLLKEINNDSDAEWHFFKRAPSKAPFYEIEDVVKDLSYSIEDMERHGQKLPLLVLLDNGSTEEDILALMQVKIYDIEVVVVDHHFPGEVMDGKVAVDDYVDTHVNPYLVGGDSQITAGALAVEIANMVNPEIKDKLVHLPGIAAVGDHARSEEAGKYMKIAEDNGYSREDLEKVATCIDFEAFFLRFMNGRGLIDTILGFGDKGRQKKLVEALYRESQKRVEWQLKAALPNLKTKELPNGLIFSLLDVEKYAHKFTFPAPGKTCGFVHDEIVKKYGEERPILTVAYGPDFSVIRATDAVNEIYGFNLNDIISKLAAEIPEAGIDGGGHECAGSLKFVEGLSSEVLSSFESEVAELKSK